MPWLERKFSLIIKIIKTCSVHNNLFYTFFETQVVYLAVMSDDISVFYPDEQIFYILSKAMKVLNL